MDPRTQKIITLYQTMPGAPPIPFYEGDYCWGDVEGNDQWNFCAAIVDAGPPLPPPPKPPEPPTYQVDFYCPHCGQPQRRGVQRFDHPQVLYCYEDEGGCGAYFVADAEITIIVKGSTHKIDGMNPAPVHLGDREEGEGEE